MKQLFKFNWDCGRMGDVDSLFIATQKQVDALLGKDVHFGEILGKHSDVSGIIDKEDIINLNLDENTVEILRAAVGEDTLSGYNPVEYYEEALADEEDEDS